MGAHSRRHHGVHPRTDHVWRNESPDAPGEETPGPALMGEGLTRGRGLPRLGHDLLGVRLAPNVNMGRHTPRIRSPGHLIA